MTRADLAELLGPVDLASRDAVRFQLPGYTSAVTRELLTIRLRRQAEVFETGTSRIHTRLSTDGATIEVDAVAMMAANAIVTARLEEVAGSVRYLRKLARAGEALSRSMSRFEAALACAHPSVANLLAYLDANTAFQTLGALRFCLPGDLRARVDALVPGESEALLASEVPSLWLGIRLRELALARARHRGSPAHYDRLRRSYRRNVGYLGAEDMDFEAAERDEAIDARIAAYGNLPATAAAMASIAAVRRQDRARRRSAAVRFAASGADARLIAIVLLARELAAHEDRNRRAKMRLLRNLRDLALHTSLDPTRMTLEQVLAVCSG